MKPTLLTGILLLFLFTGCLSQVQASVPTVIIAGYQVSPAVLMPGDTGTLSFTLTTTDEDDRRSQSTGIIAGNGFSNTESTAINVHIYRVYVEGNGIIIRSRALDRVGDLGPGQSLPLTVLIQAPEQEGIYFPEVWIDTGTDFTSGVSTRYPIPVNVNTQITLPRGPDLSLQKTIPESVVPGHEFNCSLLLRNDGEGRADDIHVTIGTAGTSLSLHSPANYHLDHLNPGDMKMFELPFISDRDMPVGICTIPVQIRYSNVEGKAGNLSEEIGIAFIGKAELSVKSLTCDPVIPDQGRHFTFIARIENTGTDRATSVMMNLSNSLEGTKKVFIGSIDKNSDAPAVFDLRSPGSGEIPLTLTVTYTDEYGFHSIDQGTALLVNPANGGIVFILAIILVVPAGTAYWYLRKRRVKNE
ncbi:MAG: hypothetical protein LUQ07_06850 [Methanospirillum sp.]|nr:hypothetical protein [Methanospirillum sp.]